MEKLQMYCLAIDDSLKNKIKELNYIPVGLGNYKFSEEWLRDNTGENISNKNSYYGEYTFHYWLWKNQLNQIPENTWIGFCAYRRFWSKTISKPKKIIKFEKEIIQTVDDRWKNYDVILGDKIDLTHIKWIKVLKYGKISFLRNPYVIFKSKRNIRFHFDMFHGNGYLDKAINLLSEKDREDFRNFTINNSSYNQGNMFITKSKSIMKRYYEEVFDWLEKCESIFGFDLHGYEKTRIYGFLAERLLPYWFNKYTKVFEWPILFYDFKKENEN
tara:strand:+ start:138 stop:953 length:816 start_codon:yes stop_codon:yes gene_type:complete